MYVKEHISMKNTTHTRRISVAAGGRSKIYKRVAVRRYYARNLLSVCYLGACKFPPSSQCTEYFRIILRMTRVTTRREEGEKL